MAAWGVRITGGSARGVPLTEPRGVRLRPTSGLVREAIFNVLGASIADARVLDLFAGTGALGIEALSRGARHATFYEAEAGAVTAILASLARTGLDEKAKVVRGRLPAALATLNGEFDVIFLDPPYGDAAAEPTLMTIDRLLAPEGTVVYEHASRYNPPERPARLRQTERRVYGDTAVALYALQEGQ